MFTLEHPSQLVDILKYQLQIFGRCPVLLLSFPQDSIAFEWVRQEWSDVHANTGERAHLFLMGTTYAQSGCEGFTVPLGLHGYGTAICFKESSRLEGMEWLRTKDARLAFLDSTEAYAIALEMDAASGSWSTDKRPLHAVAQLTTDHGRAWRNAKLAELEMVIAPLARSAGFGDGVDIGERIRGAQSTTSENSRVAYLAAAARLLDALRKLLS